MPEMWLMKEILKENQARIRAICLKIAPTMSISMSLNTADDVSLSVTPSAGNRKKYWST